MVLPKRFIPFWNISLNSTRIFIETLLNSFNYFKVPETLSVGIYICMQIRSIFELPSTILHLFSGCLERVGLDQRAYIHMYVSRVAEYSRKKVPYIRLRVHLTLFFSSNFYVADLYI